ncbi:hypothetical protein [Arcobacter defluvii]|uniref:Uncharacterized protein n=1 Tax=Arcobacter defluvii TaxID=873191 RepID=A0AAE7BG76_9BACT|nr:hypothetical protein [Arcobacter defluvii]QKF77958.1 hypothetical protein ADFLV_1942 [Arcobacter defluvii]RXI32736.1 hypothetical protein CP964_07680 [Arcobacter defluvii]
MKEKSLFDMTDEIVVEKFSLKDVFFNNGIANLYHFLKERDFEFEYELNQNELILKIDSQKQDEVYNQILNTFLKDNKIVYQTDNDRWYFDETKMNFILDRKFDTKGGQKNDLRNGVYLYKKISELGLSREEVERLYLDFCEKTNFKPEKEPNGKLKVPNKKNEVIVAITLDEAIKKFSKYFVSNDILSIDSKIHSFEDGQCSFHDMLNQPKSYKLDKWNALIYWFGGRTKRFYNFSYFIYPNSSNLQALNKFKEFLQIDDDKREYRDEKDKIVTTSSNIDFFEVLSKDEIVNKHFYISKSAEEFELKFFMYLFSMMYHIEERYEKANERRRERQKELFETLQYLSFVIYTDDGTFKTSLSEYTRAYQLIQFFQVLKENNLFKYFADLLYNISIAKKKKKVEAKEIYNQYTQLVCLKILNFQETRNILYLTSFEILKTMEDKKQDSYYNRIGDNLFLFEQSYLNYILGGKNMGIHEDSKIVGDGVGHFCAELGDKDLLFKLRSVKNYKQLVSYFKDLKFSALKNKEEARFTNEFNDSLENILINVEQNWEIVRDYIAIYAIDKFKSVDFAKNQPKK